MRDLASSAPSFPSSSALLRVLRFEGFGGRRDGEAMICAADGRRAGSLLSGAADPAIAALDLTRASVVEVPVGDADAVRSGLACGGTAHLLVQPLSGVPSAVWERIADRDPFVLVTVLEGGRLGESSIVASGSSGTAVPDDVREAALAHLRSGRSPTATFVSESGPVHLESVSPPPHAVVIGTAELAMAIARQGALLGWSCDIVEERSPDGVALATRSAAALGPVDALIVLSHDLPASCAALATALRGRCGYVGALGSRHTQAARRERLLAVEELHPADADRVHGPIGLDLGSRTPEETALAIFAEILAVRRGRNAASLSASDSPING